MRALGYCILAIGVLIFPSVEARGQATTAPKSGDSQSQKKDAEVSPSNTPPGEGSKASSATSKEEPSSTSPAKVDAAAAKPFDFWSSKNLTGDWGGLRNKLKDDGVTVDLFLNQQFQQNFHGGLRVHDAQQLSGSYDLDIALDFGKLGLWKDAGFFMRAGKGTWTDGLNPKRVEALMNVNADAGGNHVISVEKWWYWQKFLDKKIELRLGMLTTNKDLFDVGAYANHEDKDFLNRGSIRDMTIPHRTGLGGFVKFQPIDWFYFQMAGVDAQSLPRRTGFDTAFHRQALFVGLWEMGVTPKWSSAKGPMPGNLRLGWWYDPNSKPLFTDTLGGRRLAGTKASDSGYYLGADQMVWKENDDAKDTQGLGVYARYGHAHADSNKITDYWAVGMSYKGLIPTRDQDVTAFGVAQSILSERYGDEIHPFADRETVYEWYYSYQLTPCIIISPDFQVVENPGGDRIAHDAIIGGVRVRIIF